jgi:phosphoesterase RecJ-like protein
LKGTTSDIFKQIQQLCKQVKHIVIITHNNPDGDAIGSSLGLYHLLKNIGHEPTVIVPNEYPEFLHWLPGHSSVIKYNRNKSEAVAKLQQADVIFFLDFNVPERIGDLAKEIPGLKAKKILIDHHPYPGDFCDFVISETEVSSTAELVYDFIESCNHKNQLDKNVAECLFTGLLTDTVCFSVNAFRPRTFEVASGLLALGINRDDIHNNVFNNFSAERMRLLGYCLNEKMIVFPEYQTAFFAINKAEQKKYNFQPGDSEGFVNYALSIKGIVFSALLLERENHVKISFRSKGDFAINKFASEHFGGGGHKNAAGGEIHLPLTEVIEKFNRLLPEFYQSMKHTIR